MRVIEADLGEVCAVAVAPGGRFVAAAGAERFEVFHWATGEPVPGTRALGTRPQVAFAPHGEWVACVPSGRLLQCGIDTPARPLGAAARRFAGGVAVSPDGKVFVAAADGAANRAKLERWSLPALRPISGFDDWRPFSRLAFSPDGEFLAGIWGDGFELRFAVSGGIDYRHRMTTRHALTAPGFVSFDRASGTCAFGWGGEFHVLDIATGTSRPVRRVPAWYRDAAFLPSGGHFATVDDGGRLKLWDPQTWAVAREYDWGCGALTALAFTADGAAGVCGTADGRLVQFDVDE